MDVSDSPTSTQGIVSLLSVRVEDLFKNFTSVTNKLMRDYGFSPSTIQLMQRARLFKDPTVGLSSEESSNHHRSVILLGTVEFILDLSTHRLRCERLE